MFAPAVVKGVSLARHSETRLTASRATIQGHLVLYSLGSGIGLWEMARLRRGFTQNAQADLQ